MLLVSWLYIVLQHLILLQDFVSYSFKISSCHQSTHNMHMCGSPVASWVNPIIMKVASNFIMPLDFIIRPFIWNHLMYFRIWTIAFQWSQQGEFKNWLTAHCKSNIWTSDREIIHFVNFYFQQDPLGLPLII